MKDSKPAQQKKLLFRSEKERVIAGVAGGLAAYFEVDPNLVRFLFILVTLLGGSGFFIYIILWILLPAESSAASSQEETVKKNIDEIKGMAQHMANEVRPPAKKKSSHEWFAFILIALGVLFLLQNYGMLWWFSMAKLWPVILVLLGVGIMLRHDE